jgi:magnesium transporter
MSGSKYYHITPKGKLMQVATPEMALETVKAGGFLWIHFCQPTKEDFTPFMDPLNLHPLSVEDCLDENQIPKIEDFPQNTFIIFNAFKYTARELSIGEINLFIGNNFLVSVDQHSHEDRPFLDIIEHIVEREIESARRGPAFLMHVILDYVVDQKFLAIEALEDELDTIEEAILTDISDFNPQEIIRLRRDLLSLRKSLFHEREILVKICRNDCPFISGKAIFHYRDIYDHLAKFFELTESYRDFVTSLMEMYLSLLNNKMTKTANETNVTVRRLTFITTIFMPLTLLAGIGGMSEWSMMTGPQNWRIAYPAFILAMIIIGVASYFFLRKLDKRK